MNNPVFGRAVLVSGPESLLAERAVADIAKAALAERPDAATIRLPGAALDAGTLGEAAGGSLFADASLVIIEDAADLPSDMFDTVVSLAANPGPDLALMIVHPGGVKGRGLVDRLKKAKVPVVECAAIKAWELPRFAVAEARIAGGRLDQATASRLVEATGPDARAVAAAVRQLIADTDDGLITEKMVRRYFAGRADVTSFTVADHVMAGRPTDALGALRWALDTGVAPVLITSALAAALRNLGKYQDGADPRIRDADLARTIGVPVWKIKDLAKQSAAWTPRGIADAIGAVARADADIKGAASDPGYALERMVITAARLRGRRPGSSMGR